MRQSVETLTDYPFPCPNCDRQMTKAALFCSDLCRAEAKYVRYFRACVRDGRFEQQDVQEALQIRLAHILGGGYPERQRQLTKEIREAVFVRAQGRCQNCGGKGNQIDHIRGSSNDLENLQLLCVKCHNEKTLEGFEKISPETHPEEWAKQKALLSRVYAPQPTRLSDSPDWDKLWRSVQKTRREVVKNKEKKAGD